MLNLKFSLSEDLILKILNPDTKTIFVLGGVDTGKTSFIECILEILVGNYSVGVIDCDMGQSHIGPPATIGWAKIEGEFNCWEELRLEDFYFIGSLSPSGNIPRTLEGIRFIFNKAKEKTDKVIFDTTGYIFGFEAIDFKVREIEQIQPDLILALQREDELEDILKNFKEISIFRMEVPKEVRSKSREERQRYRDRCFKRCFENVKEFFFPEEIFTLLLHAGAGFKRLDEKDTDIIHRIVSLQNDKGRDLALGIIKKREDKNISILTPWDNIGEVSKIIVGLCKWEGI